MLFHIVLYVSVRVFQLLSMKS